MKGGVRATDSSLGKSKFMHRSHSVMSLERPLPHAGTKEGLALVSIAKLNSSVGEFTTKGTSRLCARSLAPMVPISITIRSGGSLARWPCRFWYSGLAMGRYISLKIFRMPRNVLGSCAIRRIFAMYSSFGIGKGPADKNSTPTWFAHSRPLSWVANVTLCPRRCISSAIHASGIAWPWRAMLMKHTFRLIPTPPPSAPSHPPTLLPWLPPTPPAPPGAGGSVAFHAHRPVVAAAHALIPLWLSAAAGPTHDPLFPLLPLPSLHTAAPAPEAAPEADAVPEEAFFFLEGAPPEAEGIDESAPFVDTPPGMLLAEAGMVRVDERMHARMHGSHAQMREAYRCTTP
mmetsp:Transcript_53674/g.148373  ORF Transcript_53674/g.148373 Transcript_53674/m.148373 type:complete len:344 (-) Transcript_53674:139-1170(-)